MDWPSHHKELPQNKRLRQPHPRKALYILMVREGNVKEFHMLNESPVVNALLFSII